MVQGGDPTGTGRGGTSIYGQKLYVRLSDLFSPGGGNDGMHTRIDTARTRSILIFGSLAQESWPWPIPGPTRTVSPRPHGPGGGASPSSS